MRAQQSLILVVVATFALSACFFGGHPPYCEVQSESCDADTGDDVDTGTRDADEDPGDGGSDDIDVTDALADTDVVDVPTETSDPVDSDEPDVGDENPDPAETTDGPLDEVDIAEVGPCGTEAPNACGGCGLLAWDSEETAPLTACGVCGDGLLVCNGTDALRCEGATGPNVCDGCGLLVDDVGADCGRCGDGALACEDWTLVCTGDLLPNPCGGCGDLDGRPGDACDTDGRLACDGTEALVCASCPGAIPNACGGCEDLGGAVPGGPCGPCSRGTWLCEGGALACEGGDAVNACGGCGPLPGSPGTSCGACDAGTWSCDPRDPEILRCVHGEGASPNACGGCGALEAEPGTPCGGDRVWVCDGADAVACGGDGLARRAVSPRPWVCHSRGSPGGDVSVMCRDSRAKPPKSG